MIDDEVLGGTIHVAESTRPAVWMAYLLYGRVRAPKMVLEERSRQVDSPNETIIRPNSAELPVVAAVATARSRARLRPAAPTRRSR